MCKCKAFCDGKCNVPDEPTPQFKVGEKVYSLVHGWGKVVRNYETEIEVWFNPIGRTYYNDGKYHNHGEVVLFHDKPTIIPAKKKVKKWYWTYQYGRGWETTSTHKSETEINVYNSGPNKVKLPWTEIEVEE